MSVVKGSMSLEEMRSKATILRRQADDDETDEYRADLHLRSDAEQWDQTQQVCERLERIDATLQDMAEALAALVELQS